MATKTMNNIDEALTREPIFIIGHVLSVDGRTVKIKVNKDKNHSHILFEGKTVKNVSVGSYIKIEKGFVSIIGKVEGEYITEEKYYNAEYKKEQTRINRILQVSLFGHIECGKFEQGVKEMPLIDNECYVLSREEFTELHKFFEPGNKKITIGHLSDEPSHEIQFCINKLFASHIGIFGNTGSGKSNTLARIYTELFRECDNGEFRSKSKFVIIDFNGEYTSEEVITKDKTIYNLTTNAPRESHNKYPIAIEDLSKTEILAVLLEATEKTQKPFLDRVIRDDYFLDEETFTPKVILNMEKTIQAILHKKDKIIRENVIIELLKKLPDLIIESKQEMFRAFISSVEQNLHLHTDNDFYWLSAEGKKTYNDSMPIYENHMKSIIDSLQFKTDIFTKLKIRIILNYYHEIVSGYSNSEHIGPLIGRMFRKFHMLEKIMTDYDGHHTEKNLIVISLKEVNLEMKKIVPLIICKQLYENHKQKGVNQQSLHLIVDEAHNILSSMSQRESESWKDYRLETFEEIIKEGRKFAVFLTIASQRPFDISPTIISQLHNYFIHKLINENDINAISRAVAYLDKLSFESIPILGVGSCFIAGLATEFSVKVDIDPLKRKKRPKSETIDLETVWQVRETTTNS